MNSMVKAETATRRIDFMVLINDDVCDDVMDDGLKMMDERGARRGCSM